MNETHRVTLWLAVAALILAATLFAGCSPQPTSESMTPPAAYTSALDASYEGALNVTTQLALGTLNLEETAEAVTREQAADLLPLWQALSGSELTDTESQAVAVRIEGLMTSRQIQAIVAMRLTQEDAQAWSGNSADAQPEAGEGRTMPAGLTEDQIAQMREQVQNMSDEDRAAMRAQAQAAGGGAASGGVIGSLVSLLQERSGAAAAQEEAPVEAPAEAPPASPQAVDPTPAPVEATPEAAPEMTPEPQTEPAGQTEGETERVVYVVRAGDTLAVIARAYGVTVEAIVEANDIANANQIEVGQELVIPDPERAPTAVDWPSSAGSTASSKTGATAGTTEAAPLPALEQVEDTSPGPPLTIEISANRATQDPLVEASKTYLVTGIVRNDGDQTYDISALNVTFYDAEGFRGTFFKFPQPWESGGEWLWHGQTEADVAALLLAPGEEWPFSVAITAQDMALFLIHPDATATGRESAPVSLSGVTVTADGTGYLRIRGTATNDNAFAVKNVTVSGALLDAGGEIVSLGSTYVLEEDIGPGESISFDLRVATQSYASYQLYAQAERDWSWAFPGLRQ